MATLLRRETLGDMDVTYWHEEESGAVGLEIAPAGMIGERPPKAQRADSLAQIMLRGDDFPYGFANGHTMRNSASVARFRLDGQRTEQGEGRTSIVTTLIGGDGLTLEHRLTCYQDEQGFEIRTAFENHGESDVTLEMLSSFSLCGITPFGAADAPESMILHRLRSKWSNEGRLDSESIEDLQLEPSWSGHGVASEKFGQVGSMPVRRFFPFAAIEDKARRVLWGAQMDSPASWQMEAYRRDDGLCLSGGLADFDFGHWAKRVRPGERFAAPAADGSGCAGDLDALCARLTRMRKRSLRKLQQPERLPVVFNEFCTTWGNPAQQKLEALLPVLKGQDIDYFVIDCGWYAVPGKGWELNMGDWNVNADQFPGGLEAAARAIRDTGMKPGLWFELEVCGRLAEAFTQTEHLLKRFGQPITAGDRRFWDMRDPWVRAYLTRKVIQPLADCGFEYLKIDYNESVGVGCDSEDGLGEGLRQSVQATQAFFREIHERVPGILIENCSSGGHRLEPSFLNLCQLASFSDSHEQWELPIIAANLHRVLLPEQSLIWAVLRADDSPRRMVWSLCATFLGVMCLSGDVEKLAPEQWAIVRRAIAFDRMAAPILQDGITKRHGPPVASYRHPKGWQAVERTSPDRRRKLIVAHLFDDAPERLTLPVAEGYRLRAAFADQPDAIAFTGKAIEAALPAKSAFAVLLDREDGTNHPAGGATPFPPAGC